MNVLVMGGTRMMGDAAVRHLLRAGHRSCGFVNADGDAVDRPERAVAFCGIGNPEAFGTDLEHQGVHVAAFRKFRDHHTFTRADWDEWAGCEARQRVRGRIASLLARPERIAVLEPA